MKKLGIVLAVAVVAVTFVFGTATGTAQTDDASDFRQFGKYIPGFEYMTREQKKRAVEAAKKRLIEYRNTHYVTHSNVKLEDLPSAFICTGIREEFKAGAIERTYRDPGLRIYDKDETFQVVMKAEGRRPGETAGFYLYYLGPENSPNLHATKVLEGDVVHSGKARFVSPTQVEHFPPIKGLIAGVYRLRFWSEDEKAMSYSGLYIRELREPNPEFFKEAR